MMIFGWKKTNDAVMIESLMMGWYDWCRPSVPKKEDKHTSPFRTQTGQQVTLTTKVHDDDLCKEFIVEYRPFSFRRWLAWTTIFNIAGFIFELHTQDSRIMTGLLVVLIILLIVKLNIRVCQESLLVSSTIGVQLTTKFFSGRTTLKFYDISEVQDIVINEGITLQRVIFYLALLLHDAKHGIELVPLYTHCWPSRTCLQQIYRDVQGILSRPKCKIS